MLQHAITNQSFSRYWWGLHPFGQTWKFKSTAARFLGVGFSSYATPLSVSDMDVFPCFRCHPLHGYLPSAHYAPGTQYTLAEQRPSGRLSTGHVNVVQQEGHVLSNSVGTLCLALHFSRSGPFDPIFNRRVGEKSIRSAVSSRKRTTITQIYHRTHCVLSQETIRQNTIP